MEIAQEKKYQRTDQRCRRYRHRLRHAGGEGVAGAIPARCLSRTHFSAADAVAATAQSSVCSGSAPDRYRNDAGAGDGWQNCRHLDR